MYDLNKNYPLVFSQELIWSDMDAFQHVNNAVYFRYFEDARMKYFAVTGVMEHMIETRIGPILASTTCNFRAPLVFPDTIHIGARIEELKNRTFKMKYAIYSDRLEKLAADGEGLVVFYDYQRQASCEIPTVIVAAFEAFQVASGADSTSY